MFGRGNKDSYLTYKKVNIGLSNISSLVFRDPEHADIINFSKDGYYDLRFPACYYMTL